jgi:UDP-glucose 4-epimerase
MKILITGGSGFIGSNLALQFAPPFVVAAPNRTELDLLDADAVHEYLVRHQFDAVIHAASERSNRGLVSNPALLDRNCRMFFNLARNSHAFGRMLFLSSGAVYSRENWLPRMSEDYFDAHVPADDYGFAKYLCAKAIEGMDRVHELRLFGVFGPHEDWRVRFISNACCRAVWGLPVVVRQNARFDYLDVQDLGWILQAFLVKPPQHRQYNVCTGRSVELLTLAQKVVRASGRDLPIVVKKQGMGTEYSGDPARILAEIPDFHFGEIDDSIARLYRWYDGHKQSIDPALLRFDE